VYRHRLAACRLADVERHLLRINRLDDVPGNVIPSLYFDYVRAGRVAPLRALFRHNAEDVLSLVGVLESCARLLSTDDLDPDDAIAAARYWEHARRPERAASLYRGALPWLEGGEDWRWVAMRHARLCKRAGLRDEAVPLWEELWATGDRAAGLELAKHYEHRRRDPHIARQVASRLLDDAEAAEAEKLRARILRLDRKLARRSRAAGDVSDQAPESASLE
jgi:hypothetical protein